MITGRTKRSWLLITRHASGLMVGGNIPGVTRTISLAIYDDVQALDYASAHRSALLMLCFAFVVLSITYALQRRLRLPTPWQRS